MDTHIYHIYHITSPSSSSSPPRSIPFFGLSLFLLCRIIEIEWAVNNNKPFKPSPKKPKRKKTKKASKDEKRTRTSSTAEAPAVVVLKDSRDENSNWDQPDTHLMMNMNMTNMDKKKSGSPQKAELPLSWLDEADTALGTGTGTGVGLPFGPFKRQAEGWETPKRSKKMRSASIADGVGSEEE